jgi:hypothetical protein
MLTANNVYAYIGKAFSGGYLSGVSVIHPRVSTSEKKELV